MKKENYHFKRISLRKDTIYRIYCTKSYDMPVLKIKFKYADVVHSSDSVSDFEYRFENEESVLEAHYKLIHLLNHSKDSDFIDIGRICDEVKNEVNQKIGFVDEK